MLYIEKILAAQVPREWVDPANMLSPAEARAEAMCHEILVSINKPKPSEWMIALVSVLSIPDAAPHGLGGAT